MQQLKSGGGVEAVVGASNISCGEGGYLKLNYNIIGNSVEEG